MSIEQTLIDMGADCVCGDLILNRRVVGQYRHGLFEATLDGVAMLEQAGEKKQAEILAVVHEMTAAGDSGDIEVDVSDLVVGGDVTPRRKRRAGSGE